MSNYNIKFIITRIAGDEETFKTIFQNNMPNIESEVFSIFDEPNKKYNIFEKYNKCIIELKKRGVNDNDLWIFCHNDCGILDNDFQKKVESLFDEKKHISAVGVVGASEIRESGCWWNSPTNSLRGHIIQGNTNSKPMEGAHLIKGSVGFFDDITVFDGLFFIVRAKAMVESGVMFRTDIFSGNHFYDLSFCMDMLLKGYNLAIADILVYHKSVGSSNVAEEWSKERDKFIKYYKSIGLSFPIDKNSINEYRRKHSSNSIDKDNNLEVLEFKL